MTSRLKKSSMTSVSSANNKKSMEKSLEEQAYEMQIHPIEAERLRKTFMRICGVPVSNEPKRYEQNDSSARNPPKDKFDRKDLIAVLTELQFPFVKPELDQWIWEIDEDLDGCINEYEFTLMYKRCLFDKTWLEPRNLFNLVLFLMYDITGRGKITVEDTLELIYVRHPEELELHIFDIFGEKEKTEDGQEREVLFEEYLRQMRKRDLEKRKKLEEQRKTVKKVKINKEQED